MSTLGESLIRSIKEALAHANGDGPGIVHVPETPQVPETCNARVDAVVADDQMDISPVDGLVR